MGGLQLVWRWEAETSPEEAGPGGVAWQVPLPVSPPFPCCFLTTLRESAFTLQCPAALLVLLLEPADPGLTHEPQYTSPALVCGCLSVESD